MNLMPWSETLDMPVEIREKEGMDDVPTSDLGRCVLSLFH